MLSVFVKIYNNIGVYDCFGIVNNCKIAKNHKKLQFVHKSDEIPVFY